MTKLDSIDGAIGTVTKVDGDKVEGLLVDFFGDGKDIILQTTQAKFGGTAKPGLLFAVVERPTIGNPSDYKIYVSSAQPTTRRG